MTADLDAWLRAALDHPATEPDWHWAKVRCRGQTGSYGRPTDRTRLLVTAGTLASALVLGACAANPRPSVPDHPIEDRLVSLTGGDLDATEEAMAALIARSRAELPNVRARFVAGLAEGETLFLTIRLYKPNRSFEQAFAEVKEWRPGGITGVLASDLVGFSEPKAGDLLEFGEDVVVDWTILGSGGTEEGNRVGHFVERRGQQK